MHLTQSNLFLPFFFFFFSLHLSFLQVKPSSVVSYKGYLNFLESRDNGWKKKFVCVRMPYVYVTDHEKDPVIRGVMHLSNIKIQYVFHL